MLGRKNYSCFLIIQNILAELPSTFTDQGIFILYITGFNDVNCIIHQYHHPIATALLFKNAMLFGKEINLNSFESCYVCTLWTKENVASV